MDALNLLIVVLCFAVVMYCINNFFAIEAKLKQLINIIFLVLFLMWILFFAGLPWHHAVIR